VVDTVILAVFVLVHLGMLLGEIPGLALDRTGVALLGALALVAVERVTPAAPSGGNGAAAAEGPEAASFGDLSVNSRRHEASKGGRELELTPREFRLLAFLLCRRGQIVTRQQLLDVVWGYDTMPVTRTVDTHIAKLRKKIEDDPGDSRHIVTVHRLGYKFTG